MVPALSRRVSRVPRYSGSRRVIPGFTYGAFTLSGRSFQFRSVTLPESLVRSEPRGASHPGLGSSRFARRYSGNHFCFLLLRLLRCFSSPGSPPRAMDSRGDAWGLPMRVSPFRHPRVTGYVPLTAAFRSLSRLSSAPSAKASALRLFLLNQLYGPPLWHVPLRLPFLSCPRGTTRRLFFSGIPHAFRTCFLPFQC